MLGRMLIAIAVAAFSLSPVAARAQEGMAPVESGHVEVNGLAYYYEVHGEGEPLLLLHGGLGHTGMFAPILPALSKGRTVIGVDLQGHGRTALGARPIDIADMGRDMGQLVEKLGYDRVDVIGYSMGGGVAAQMAVQYPERVRRLVLVSTPASKDGFYPEIVEQMHQINGGMAEAMRDTPMYQSYAAVAPRVEDFPKLLDAMGDLMRRPDIYDIEVEALEMPVMLVYGDSDMFRLEHVVAFYQRLGGGLRDAGWQREHMSQNRLAILPGRTHYDIFFAPALVPTARSFLDGENATGSWAEQVGAGQQ